MWIKFSKLLYFLLVIYYGWFQIVFFKIPHMLIILGAGMFCFIIFDALQNGTSLLKPLTIELQLWILFAFTSFVFGLLIAVDQGYLTSSLSTFSQFLLLMFCIVYISNQDRKIDFFVMVFIIFALLCAITTVLWGVDTGQGRIAMASENNPNGLGVAMTIGVCCILYKLSLKKLIYSIMAFSAIFLLIYVTLLTGSRKAFISTVIILVYWLLFVVFDEIISLTFVEKIKGMLSIILLLTAGYYLIYPHFNDSPLVMRLTELFQGGEETRIGMYAVAFDLFKQSPLLGIGFNNYRALSVYNTYSHSTYSEALACTGIIGSILYFAPYIILVLHFGRFLRTKTNTLLLKQTKVMIGLFGVLLFLGVGLIHFYEMISSIAFGMLIAFFRAHSATAVPNFLKSNSSVIASPQNSN